MQSLAHGYGHAPINSYADAFVFDEMGVTFSVYPDGEFDFYMDGLNHSTTMSNGFVDVTFNSGYNYNPYVQYDDFGAVIQVENVPIYYDYYGRVTQIGDVMINYRNRRVCQVGGLRVFYNRRGYYAYHTGFINVWNPYFVYRPFYVAFARPAVNLCFVRPTPYRQYYRPVRYTYYRPYVRNTRPCYATIGHTYRPRGGNGVAHASYRQSAGRGEVAFKRERRTVTTASVRPASTINGRALNSNVNRGSSARTANNSSRSVKPATTNRQVISSNPRQVQTAPSRTQNNTSVNPRSAKSRTSTNSSSNRAVRPTTTTRTQSAVKPSVSRTSSRITAPSRTQTVSKPTVQRSSSNQSGGRTISKPQSTTRSSNSITRSSNLNSRSGSSVSKTPSRSSSSSRTVSKGSAGNTISKRGK